MLFFYFSKIIASTKLLQNYIFDVENGVKLRKSLPTASKVANAVGKSGDDVASRATDGHRCSRC
jgi:hypothetical protein